MQTIVHLIPGLFLGGAEKVLEIIVTNQIKEGNKVVAISFEKTQYENFFKTIPLIHCTVTYKDRLFHNSEIDVDEYESAINELKPNYIHSHSYWTDLISHRNLRKDVFYITHFHLCYPYFEKVSFSKLFSSQLFVWIDKQKLFKKYTSKNCSFIASSSFIKEFYSNRFPRKVLKKFSTIANPVDDIYFRVTHTKKKYDLLTIGRVEEVKNHEFLIHVLNQIKKKGSEISLAIVGEGSRKQHLIKLASELHLIQNAFFLGGIKNLSEIFSTSGIYVHSAYSETFGLAIFEAMAAGLPVVLHEFEGLDRGLMINGHNCLIIKDWNKDAFASAIFSIINDPVLASRLSENGRKTALQFSCENYFKMLNSHYEKTTYWQQNP